VTDHSPRGLIMLAATPVGNAGDASARLVDALATSDVIAAEFPEAHHMVRRLEFTRSTASKIEARFYGSDRAELRGIAEQTMQHVIEHQPIDRKIDWREQRLSLAIIMDHRQRQRLLAPVNLPVDQLVLDKVLHGLLGSSAELRAVTAV